MLLTIIIPFHDRIEEIEKRINELKPFYESIKVILIDDGSSIMSKRKLSFLGLLKHVTVTMTTNVGRMNAIRAAVTHIDTEYVCIADSDDPFNIGNLKKLISVILPECVEKRISRIICEPAQDTNLTLAKQENIFRYWEKTEYKENKEILDKDTFCNSFSKIKSRSHRIPTQTLWCHAFSGHKFYTCQLKLVEKWYLQDGISKNIWRNKIRSSASMVELYALMFKKDKNSKFLTKTKYLTKLVCYLTLSKCHVLLFLIKKSKISH
jgi:glycosyltransferase involved in cell wall biosynthesis